MAAHTLAPVDWPSVIEKAGAALAGVIAALGGVAAMRSRKTRAKKASVSDPCPEKLADVDAEVARLWGAIAELREELRQARAELVVARHDRQSGPGSRRG